MREPAKTAAKYRSYAASLRKIAARGGPLRQRAETLAVEFDALARAAEAAAQKKEVEPERLLRDAH